MNLKTLFCCILCPVLLRFSFPYFDCAPLAWIALVPLFFAIAPTTRRRAFWLSYLSGLIFFLLTIGWLVYVTLTGLIILCLYLAFYFAFFGYFFAGIAKRKLLQRPESVIFLSCVWVVLEYIRSHLITGFAWALLGYSQYREIAFIQGADITGALGISFVVMVLNLCCFVLLNSLRQKNYTIVVKYILGLAILFLFVYGYGMYSLGKYSKNDRRPGFRVALLQGNIAQEEKWQSSFRSSIKKTYTGLSQRAAKSNADLLIWPETSYPDYIIGGDEDAFQDIADIVQKIKKPLLFGAVLDEGAERYFNAAFLVSPSQADIETYRKIHLVPFGEYIPLRKFLPFLEQVVPIGDFSAGKAFTIFHTDNAQGNAFDFGVLICFEDTVSELSRQFRLRGIDFLVNITNDAWFKATASPYQHLQASVFRAIENRVYVVRAANTGVSCIIDECGRILGRVADSSGNDIFVEGFLDGEVKKSSGLSLWTRFGDWFSTLCAAYMFFFVIYMKKKMWYDG